MHENHRIPTRKIASPHLAHGRRPDLAAGLRRHENEAARAEAGIGDATIYKYFPTKERSVGCFSQPGWNTGLPTSRLVPCWRCAS